MLKTKFTPLNREQFALLREAKRLVATEFKKDLKIQDKDIMDQIYGFAFESAQERLYEIFNTLHSSFEDTDSEESQDSKNVIGLPERSTNKNVKKKANNDPIKVGDVLDGKKCVGFYRGQPIYK